MSVRIQALGIGGPLPVSALPLIRLKATNGEAVLKIRPSVQGDELIVEFPNGTVRVLAKD